MRKWQNKTFLRSMALRKLLAGRVGSEGRSLGWPVRPNKGNAELCTENLKCTECLCSFEEENDCALMSLTCYSASLTLRYSFSYNLGQREWSTRRWGGSSYATMAHVWDGYIDVHRGPNFVERPTSTTSGQLTPAKVHTWILGQCFTDCTINQSRKPFIGINFRQAFNL